MTRLTRRAFAASAAAAAAGLRLARPAFAQAYPTRPVTIVVPWGAGGGTDAVARIIAALLEKDLGQPFNVINRTGGSGVVGHAAIAAGAPDGYTLGMITVEIAMMHWQGLTELKPEELHAARTDERGPARHPGQSVVALQDRQGARRRHQGVPCRQVEGLGHRPGRHLASRARRLAARRWVSRPTMSRGCRRTALRPRCRISRQAGLTSSPARCRKRARSSRPARRARSR